MKISIGINGFKSFEKLEKRERLCIESLNKIKNKFSNISLYNICFTDENVSYENFTTLNNLEIKSCNLIREYFKHEGLQNEYKLRKNQIDNNKKELPSVKEIFDVLSSTDCDYFLFLNNDIILSDRILKEIDDHDSFSISRMHIFDIDSLSDIPKLESYSIHGFDAFLIKRQVWLEIRNNFEHFILGRPYWDTYFATMLSLLCKSRFINKLPPTCFHIEHGSTSMSDSIESYYNEDVFKRNILINHMWFNYVYSVLLKRPTVNECKWYQPLENEDNIERSYFNQFNVSSLTINDSFEKLCITDKQQYDIFIPVAPKDEIKLPYVIEKARINLTSKKIYICSPHDIKNKINDSNIIYIKDQDILDIPNKSFITFRPNWTYQQFLKLSFNLSSEEYYFTLDADTLINKPLPLFENNHPIWYYGWKQNHFPYFLFNKKIFNLNKTLDHTGIGDLGLFNKNIIKTFLNHVSEENMKDLLLKIGNKTNQVFHFSEYETYANFANQHYPGLYEFKHLSQQNNGKDLNQGQEWTKHDIETIFEQSKNIDKHIISLHSWKI